MREQSYRSEPVILVEPSSGRTVKFKVLEKNEALANIYMNDLKAMAEIFGATWKVSGNMICIEFPDGDMAEGFRQGWR